jgi:uncharacterized protein (DUF362 family)
MSAEVYLLRTHRYDRLQIRRFLEERCAAVFACIQPGMGVVLKPNWVAPGPLDPTGSGQVLTTHPDLITAVLEVVVDRLQGSGRVLICDGPQTDSSFDRLLTLYPVQAWQALCEARHIPFQILDLREDEWTTRRGAVVLRRKLPGDPLGSTEVNLPGDLSEFFGHRPSSKGYYGADYNIAEVNAAHNGQDNRYRVSRSVMEADVFINLPKLKTHLKAGITASLKNLVGINTYKNFLPHYTLGGPEEGGDQFPRVQGMQRLEAGGGKWLKQRVLKHTALARLFSYVKPLLGRVMGEEGVIRSGCWHGNDTLWRMVLDLNKVFFYADTQGRLVSDRFAKRRLYISVVDAVAAGQGDGPLRPQPCALGALFCGSDPVVLDTVCARGLGFDYRLIPTLRQAWMVRNLPLTDCRPEEIRIHTESGIHGLDELRPLIGEAVCPARGWEVLAEKRTGEAR